PERTKQYRLSLNRWEYRIHRDAKAQPETAVESQVAVEADGNAAAQVERIAQPKQANASSDEGNHTEDRCNDLQRPPAHPIRLVARSCDIPWLTPGITNLHCQSHIHHDGKHFPKASSNRGDPLMRIFRRSKAQTRLRSFARKPSHVWLSAV